MGGAYYGETNASLKHFSKRVPATSASPTYKLTLPSEVVLDALGHLLEKDFKLVDESGQRSWIVSILPRKNKEKYEYTLQGWRAFAEERNVRTGDMLDFAMVADDRLQISVTKRSELESLASGGTDVRLRDAGATASSEEAEASPVLRSRARDDAPGRRFEGISESAARYLSKQALQLSPEIREDVISPPGLLSQASAFSTELATPRQPSREQVKPQPFYSSSGMGAFAPRRTPPSADHLWLPQQVPREAASGRKRPVDDMMDAGEAELAFEAVDEQQQQEELLGPLDFSSPASMSGNTLLASPSMRQQSSLLPTTAPDSPLATMRANGRQREALELGGLTSMGSATRQQEAGDLRAALNIAMLRARQKEAEAAALASLLGTLRGEVRHFAGQAFTLAEGLCDAAGRLSAAGSLNAPAHELGMLSTQLQQYATGIADTLWHLQSLAQERNSSFEGRQV